jgi:hypothetical protein
MTIHQSLRQKLERVRKRIHPTNRRADLRVMPKITFEELELLIAVLDTEED